MGSIEKPNRAAIAFEGEVLLVSDALGVDHEDGQFAELLIVGNIVDAEHLGSFGDEGETTRHSDSCHFAYPPV